MVVYAWDIMLYFGFFLAACVVASIIYCLLSEARNAAKDAPLTNDINMPTNMSQRASTVSTRRISWL